MRQKKQSTQQFLEGVKNSLRQRIQTPYQINLLEEVHIHDDSGKRQIPHDRRKVCENAHTRILKKFLEFQYGNGFPILQSLLNMLSGKSESDSWKRIKVGTPGFTSEANCCNTKGRIDLLIAEPNRYAIVFENKINDAVEQNSQLARYIKHLIAEGYNKDCVFIVYLSSEGTDPEDGSWRVDGHSYKAEFRERFVNLSYKNCLLPWLSNDVSNQLRTLPDQAILQSALSQYVNYLQGKFFLLNNENDAIIGILTAAICEGDFDQQVHDIDSKVVEVRKYCDVNQHSGSALLETAKKTINGLVSIKRKKLFAQINVEGFQLFNRGILGRNKYIGYSISMNGHDYVFYMGDNVKDNGGYFFCSIIDLNKGDTLFADCRDCDILHYFPIRSKNGEYVYVKITPGKDITKYDYKKACDLMRVVLQKLI